MKYAIGSCMVLLACIVAGILVVRLLARRRERPWGRAVRALLVVATATVLFLVAGAAYLLPYSRADAAAQKALQSDADVEVSKITVGYRFDGPGASAALAFYPGAKVDSVAYAPLLREVAAQGIDCFVVDPPLHLSVLAQNAMDELVREYDYEWIVAGHSLGGMVAANYAGAHPDEVAGLVLLAAYPMAEIPDDIELLSVYGSCDGVLERQLYDKGRAFWPSKSREVVIEGGNHAQFGCYGSQAGDDAAAISPEAQRTQTTQAIVGLCRSVS